MQIKVKRYSRFPEVQIFDGNTSINLGMLNDQERDELAEDLLKAVYEIGPSFSVDCDKWLAEMLAKCGIELANTGDK